MKRVLLTFTLFLCIGYIQAQCVISGPDSLEVGSTGVYTIPSSLGQCSECYDWDIVSGNVSIVGTDQNNSVTIQVNGTGSFQLSVTYFDETGCHTCNITKSSYCDVTQSGIYFVNLLGDQNLKFYTMPTLASGGPNSFSYYWTFTYADGSTSWSYDREPYIPVYCDNPIKFAEVVVSSAYCDKDITHQWLPGICGTGGLSPAAAPATSSIEVVPNPTTSVVHFKGANLQKYKVSVFDKAGTIIIRDAILTGTLNLEKQKPDVYIYVIKDAKGLIIKRGKIIKN